MTEAEKEKKTRYCDSQRRATLKYRQERAQVMLTMSKEERDKIKAAATDAGQSVNKFILDKVLKSL